MKRILIFLLAAVLTGCVHPSAPPPPVALAGDPRLIQATHDAVGQLLAAIPPERALSQTQPILVATLVNIDDLKGSRLGRLLAEQVGTQLANSGLAVVELKLRGTLFVREGEGEFLLSRELRELTLSHQAQAVVVGTYAPSLQNVYITLKIVSAADSQVIAAHDFTLPLDGNVRSLLWAQNR